MAKASTRREILTVRIVDICSKTVRALATAIVEKRVLATPGKRKGPGNGHVGREQYLVVRQ
jgi:hypothetical protein